MDRSPGWKDSRHILLCSLGASWAVIPEIWCWLRPDGVDLYAHHPQRASLDATRRQHGLPRPDELWVCTSGGELTQKGLAQLRSWWTQMAPPAVLRIWVAQDTDQLASEAECARMRELIFRCTLLASERTGREGGLMVALAGGRKTMSADMQDAASLFGAGAWLHVVGPEPLPQILRDARIESFLQPLAADAAAGVMPLVAGTGTRSELLDVELDGHTVTAARFPLALPESGAICVWPAPAEPGLHAELDRRRREGGRLLSNFVADLAGHETYENWRSLYRLSPHAIRQLRETPLDESHRDWLIRLPKADLHRHVGGALSLDAQRDVAEEVWAASDGQQRKAALERVRSLLDADTDWPWDWPERVHGPQRALASAALLLHARPEVLQRQLYGLTEPRVALKERHPQKFAAYERPGELSGSALLCSPAAIAPYARALLRQAKAEGLAYMELRGSPQKYRPDDPAAFLREFEQALQQAGARTRKDSTEEPRIGFIWILDRRPRHRREIAVVVKQAVAARREMPGFVLGLDLAGDEGTTAPDQLASDFAPAFVDCMPITIHAGEGERADHIWQAAYHLHADRIGHGLTVIDNPDLAQRFRDRRIALELCPTSNREVVGFRDPAVAESAGLPDYPLRRMMDAGLPLSLCTDNPGISRTTLADEFITAARMIGGLRLWEALALIRNSFAHAMLSAEERDGMMRGLEARVAACVLAPDHRSP